MVPFSALNRFSSIRSKTHNRWVLQVGRRLDWMSMRVAVAISCVYAESRSRVLPQLQSRHDYTNYVPYQSFLQNRSDFCQCLTLWSPQKFGTRQGSGFTSSEYTHTNRLKRRRKSSFSLPKPNRITTELRSSHVGGYVYVRLWCRAVWWQCVHPKRRQRSARLEGITP